ncbi:hypothetical protein BGX29_003929, partial [Mortierella sp. GBA35]
TFKMKIMATTWPLDLYKAEVGALIQQAASGKIELDVRWTPTITLGDDPTWQYPLYGEYVYYPGHITLLTGPDFPQIMTYFDNFYAPKNVAEPTPSTVPIPSPTATTTVEPTAVPTSTVSPIPTATTTVTPEIPPSPSSSSSPSSSPVVEPSPTATAA